MLEHVSNTAATARPSQPVSPGAPWAAPLETHASAALIWLLGCRRQGDELIGGALGPTFSWNLVTGVGQLDDSEVFTRVWDVYCRQHDGDRDAAANAADRFVNVITGTPRNDGAWKETIPPKDQFIPKELLDAERAGRALRYTLEEGQSVFFVMDGQAYTYGHSTRDRHKVWRARGSGRRILYALQRLRGLPDAPVILVADEAAVLSLQALVPEAVVSTWHGALDMAAELDLAPLAGRDVILWPGADDVSHAAVAMIADRLRRWGQTVQWISDPDAWTALGRAGKLSRDELDAWIRTADALL